MEDLNFNQASPILLIRVPFEKTEEDVVNILMDFEESPINDEYHVLVVKNYHPGESELQIECVNSTFTELEFEKFKNQILNEMEKAQRNRLKNKT